MAAGTSDMVLFIAAIVAATAMAGIIVTVSADYGHAVSGRLASEAEDMDSEIIIINDPEVVSVNPLVIYVQNTGARSVPMTNLVAIIDGVADPDIAIDVLQSADDANLAPGQVAEVTITVTTASGDHIVQLITQNGEKATFEFFQP